MGSSVQVQGAEEWSLRGTQTASLVEEVDSDLVQEQTQSVCEELQRRGACTTLALARHLGFEKSSAVSPLMFLLLEKNVVMRVSDFPPIWSLSPSFPMSPNFGSNQSPMTPHTPLTLGSPPVSCVVPPVPCSPTLQAPVPASVTPAPDHIATPTVTPAPTTSPASIPIVTPASISPAPMGAQDVIKESAPFPASNHISTTASANPAKTPAPIVTVTPVPTQLPISIPFSVTVDPMPASSSPDRKPDSTSAATTLDPSQDPSPEFVVSRTALTFLEHVIPVPEEDSEEDEVDDEDADEDEVFVENTSTSTPLPALTFTEHLVPQGCEENEVTFVVGKRGIKPPLRVTPTAATARDVGRGHRHRQRKMSKQNHHGRKHETPRRNRYFQWPVKSEDQRTYKKPKTGVHLIELQIRILKKLGEMGPSTTADLTKALAPATSRDVNPALDDLLKQNFVFKIGGRPPVWRLCEPDLHNSQPKKDPRFSDSDESW